MGRIFNIAGPCRPEQHYMLPATARVPDVRRLIEDIAWKGKAVHLVRC